MLHDFGKTHLALKRVQTLLRNFGTLTECMAQKKTPQKKTVTLTEEEWYPP
jgi:hypothetical protein